MTASEMTSVWKTRVSTTAGVVGSAALAAGSAESGDSGPAAQPQPTERAIFLLVDRSPSLLAQPDRSLPGLLARRAETAPIAFTKWENLVDVVGSLSQAPVGEGQGLSVSLDFFPEATHCDVPPKPVTPVATDTLPETAGSLERALVRAGSDYAAATSLMGAMESSTQLCHELSVRKPGAQCSLVPVTDGGTNACDSAGAANTIARVKWLQASGVTAQMAAMSGADVPALLAIAGGAVAVAAAESPGGLRSAMGQVLRDAQAPAAAHQGWAGIARNEL